MALPLKAKRVLFLGDSITHSGGYIAWIETQCRLQGVDPLPEFVNVGLSSETCTGLSEPDHPFPRPDIHERLQRALDQVQPDVVVACYGMNDGIYYPFSQARFVAYQRGIGQLIEKVHAVGSKLVLLTPPPFDAVPLRQQKGKLKPPGEEKYAWFAIYEHYDREVIARYARWILEQKGRVSMVVDLHSPLTKHLAEQRKRDPSYTLAPDGVHPNPLGQRMIGETVLRAWGISKTKEPGAELASLMQRRMEILHDAWLTAVGHKRPGVKKGLPLQTARKQAATLLEQALPLVAKQR
ncbi:MAG: SGNH/GDSL hydrolase family protein [Planctomycetota bacterium]|nr:SGNH/GDSL hydrolase family protein [Planctomycetota bacterium]